MRVKIHTVETSRKKAFVLCAAAAALGCLLLLGLPARSEASSYPYVSPVPGARLVSPWTNVILRTAQRLDASAVNASALSAMGSVSGLHRGELTLSDDERTLVWSPDEPFALGEDVRIRLDSEALPPLAFGFSISRIDPKLQPRRGLEEILGEPGSDAAPAAATIVAEMSAEPNGCALPADYPEIILLSSDDPEPGNLFVSPFPVPPTDRHLIILDNQGEPSSTGTRTQPCSTSVCSPTAC